MLQSLALALRSPGIYKLGLRMYVKSLHIWNFKCFKNSSMRFQYPGRRSSEVALKNVNLILGDNGGGKSSVLRALAIGCLAPALTASGFVPHRLVRRVGAPETFDHLATLVAEVALTQAEQESLALDSRRLKLTAEIERRDRSPDRIITSEAEITARLGLEISDDFLVIGYGATRRLEADDYVEGSHRRSRGLRYARVAGLFEDHVALRPLEVWAYKLRRRNPIQYREAVDKINQVLPERLRFTGEYDADDSTAIFIFDGHLTPLSSLSDGYKSFIGWVADLIGHLVDAAEGKPLVDLAGLVLVDEIDLHLHPEWQRNVVPTIAKAFPKLQFVFTTHSPLIASTVTSHNILVTDVDLDGNAVVKQLEERAFGRSIEQLLLSSYFGLETTKPSEFASNTDKLFTRAASGDADAAIEFLKELAMGAGPKQGDEE